MQSGEQKVVPKLRQGLSVSFDEYNTDGNPQWMIHDSGRNKFFMIGWIEYELFKRWHLKTPEAIIEAVNKETTLQIEMHDLESFLKFLSENYLIQQSSTQIYRLAKLQHLFKKENWTHWLIYSYLFFKIHIISPDKFLQRTKRVGDFLFHPYTVYVALFLAVIALYQINLQWDEFTHTFSTIFTLKGLIFYFIAFTVCKFMHELGHAYMCRKYNIPVPSLGIAFMVFWPVLYTDTTLSWKLKSKDRFRIALAGIWVESYVTIIAALIWCNTEYLTLKSICYLIITVNWVMSLLINVSPFMRFDGYYVLADFLKMPNLQSRAFALTRWQIRRWLFGWEDLPPEEFSPGLHYFLIIYSFATWTYRLIIYFGIALLVYHFFIKLIGIILFIIEIIFFILKPIYDEIRFWLKRKDKFSWNKQTRVTIGVTVIFIILFLLPLESTIELPATAGYDSQFIFALEEGTLETPLPPPGTPIKANQPIAKLSSAEIDFQLKRIELESKKKLDELRRASVDAKYSQQKGILQSDLSKLQAEYHQLIDRKKRLILTVPFDSVIIDVASDLQPGDSVMKDEWIGDAIDPHKIEVEAFVSQADINRTIINLNGYFYPENISESRISVSINSIEVINSKQLNCRYSEQIRQNQNIVVETPCYHANEFGGSIATYLSVEGNFVPINSVYRVLLTTTQPTKLNQIERGVVILKTKPYSLASVVFHKIRKILLEEVNF